MASSRRCPALRTAASGRWRASSHGGRSRGIAFGSLGLVALFMIASGQAPAAPPASDEETVRKIAAELRCVVCQNLSVADSPSETANQMRAIIRERLAAGETPEQVIAYFVEKYGQWILLSPPKRGFTLLVWVLPFGAAGLGLAIALALIHRWSRKPAVEPVAPPVDPLVRDRIRREVAELDR
jgi:cytochrome c-type biogenesis protein CcmH